MALYAVSSKETTRERDVHSAIKITVAKYGAFMPPTSGLTLYSTSSFGRVRRGRFRGIPEWFPLFVVAETSYSTKADEHPPASKYVTIFTSNNGELRCIFVVKASICNTYPKEVKEMAEMIAPTSPPVAIFENGCFSVRIIELFLSDHKH